MHVHRGSWARSHPLLVFLALAYGLSWAIEIPLALQARGAIDLSMPYGLHYLSAYGPMVAAIVVTGLTGGREGLRELGQRMGKWRVRPLWWLVAAAPLVAYGVLAVVVWLVQGRGPSVQTLGEIDFLPNLGLSALPLWIATFGLGEETGWRGFALPRLQRGRSALSATLILWVLWAVWHVPLFSYLYGATAIVGTVVGLLAGAVTFTWLYNSTGSVLLVAVWHGAFNFVTGCVACKTGVTAAVLSTLVMIWAIVVVAWFKPATLSPTGKGVAARARRRAAHP